jgi:ribosomal protein S18 acetylase RimI-like enzyme
MAAVEHYTIRLATPDDDPAIAALVVEGFLDQFVPVFGDDPGVSGRIMEKWVGLEHTSGGVRSLVAETEGEIVASVGVRTSESQDSVLARGLWRIFRRNLGLPRAVWATTLLSSPRYAARPSEAYVERLVVSRDHRGRGVARSLLHRAESLGGEAEKKTVGLHVSGNNEPAIGLYDDEGYAEVSRQRSLLTGYFLGIREWLYLRKEL